MSEPNYNSRIEALAKGRGVDFFELLEYWNERAAIYEFEGGSTRKDADWMAFAAVVELLNRKAALKR